MRKGVILYITEGKEHLKPWMDLRRERQRLQVDALCLATSEFEVSHGWWQLMSRGMQEITCVHATYDAPSDTVHCFGQGLRLCG